MNRHRLPSVRAIRHALTLLEMVIGLAVVGLLLAMLAPALLSSREESHRAKCGDNLRRLGAAISEHVAKHRYFPPSHSHFKQLQDTTWTVRLLPCLDEQGLYDRYQFELPWSHMANSPVKTHNLGVQLCPASRHKDDGQGDYAAIYGPHKLPGAKSGWQKGRAYAAGIMIAIGGDTENAPVRPAEVTDGLSKTLTICEDAGRLDESRFWVDPFQALVQESPINATRVDEIFSDHPGGAFVLFADGHYHFLPESTDLSIIDALATRAGGEIIPDVYTHGEP